MLTANKDKGFTLFDLIIVILILGVLGMIAIPQFQSMVAESKLNEAAGGQLVFYPDGHSSSSDSTFVLNLAGDQRTITVNGFTGTISVQ